MDDKTWIINIHHTRIFDHLIDGYITGERTSISIPWNQVYRVSPRINLLKPLESAAESRR
ncbi:hypothetical protein J2S09_005050 [Bacillus fengqiuensis]|nr:hypothetical protein [Bacillus fengqiuensis]